MESKTAKLTYKDHATIRGFFTFEMALLFALIDEIQKDENIHGDIFEIGVHEGKSFLFLVRLLDQRSERIGACDLFGDQSLNLSRSGRGDRERFEENLRKFGVLENLVDIYECKSSELADSMFLQPVRIFHIDGGHSCNEALADLRLAARVLQYGGVIVLDDAFHPEWPGVTEAAFKFLQEQTAIKAFALGCNKLLLTHDSARGIYRRKFDSQNGLRHSGFRYPVYSKTIEMGHDVVTVICSPESMKGRSIHVLKMRIFEKGESFRRSLGKHFVAFSQRHPSIQKAFRPVSNIARRMFFGRG